MGESVGDPTATRARIRRHAGRIVRPLSHPFFLLVVGALLTSLLIPSITRSWQDHQRQVELQDELASTITRAATKYIVAVHRAKDDPKYVEKPALEAWDVERAVIASRLLAYYPVNTEPATAEEWAYFEDAAAAFYQFAIGPERARRKSRETIRKQLTYLAEPWRPDQPRFLGDTFHNAVDWMQIGLTLVVRRILEHPPRI
jgi:hypothetical protein